jgi:hypothetical protein
MKSLINKLNPLPGRDERKMKTVKKNVYYCEFCKKKGLSSAHISKHEKHCTNNPNRTCGLCERQSISELVEEFKKRFVVEECEDIRAEELTGATGVIMTAEVKWTGEPVTLQEILNAVDDCPVCVLSILRQCGFNRYYFANDSGNNLFHYEYKKELEQYWKEKNAELYEKERYSYY